MRLQRRLLPAHERATCARQLASVLGSWAPLSHTRRIACYLSHDGEMELGPLISHLWGRHKEVFLPVLHGSKVRFLPFQTSTALKPNRFGILEPDLAVQYGVSPRDLDVVLMPLVAFDDTGNRLGRGGGYYDRTFAYLRRRKYWQRPLLIGVGFAFQRVPALPARPWDVPLHGIATQHGLRLFRQRSCDA